MTHFKIYSDKNFGSVVSKIIDKNKKTLFYVDSKDYSFNVSNFGAKIPAVECHLILKFKHSSPCRSLAANECDVITVIIPFNWHIIATDLIIIIY